MEIIKDIEEDKDFSDFGQYMKGKIYCKFLGKYIDLNFEQDVPMDYVIKNAEYFNSLSDDVILKLCEYLKIYVEDVMMAYPDVNYIEGLKCISNPLEILKYIEIGLDVDMPKDNSTYVLNLSGGSDWEEEDGLQILIKDNEVVYVGVWDDLDPWMDDFEGWCNYVSGWRLNPS